MPWYSPRNRRRLQNVRKTSLGPKELPTLCGTPNWVNPPTLVRLVVSLCGSCLYPDTLCYAFYCRPRHLTAPELAIIGKRFNVVTRKRAGHAAVMAPSQNGLMAGRSSARCSSLTQLV